MASYQEPVVPRFAAELDPSIRQLHSAHYRNPDQLQAGPALLVGAGNSGAEIALELAASHRVLLAGRDVGHVPFRVEGLAARLLLFRLVLRVLFHRIMTVRTPVGRKMRTKIRSQGGPLVRTKPTDLSAANVERIGRVAGIKDGQPVLEDGRVLNVTNVIWCTGFRAGFSWIDLPVFDEQGWPEQERGIVRKLPGLYFLGHAFLYAASSTMIHGVSRDAKYIAKSIAARARAQRLASRNDPHGQGQATVQVSRSAIAAMFRTSSGIR